MRIARVLVLCLLPSLAPAQSTMIQPVQVLHRFTPSPASPTAPLIQVPGGDFYGPTVGGIIRVTSGGLVTEVAHFSEDVPLGALVLASDGGLYGTTQNRWVGLGGRATVFRFDPATRELRTIHAFEAPEAQWPLGGLVEVGGSLYGAARSQPEDDASGAIFHVVVATGQVTVDRLFGATTSPRTPGSALVLGPDGLLYGTTGRGGPATLYRFDPATDAVTVLHEFLPAEGGNPSALTLGADSSLYGSAAAGGGEGAGTLLRYTPGTSTFQLLYSLAPSNTVDGSRPGPLAAGGDGHFYGVTSARVVALSTSSWTVFRLRNTGGTFTFETLRLLDGDESGTPDRSGLTLGADGLLYGATGSGGPTLAGTDSEFVLGGPGGPAGPGTIFRFDPDEGGPPSNPIAFTLLNTFPLVTTWSPSAPASASDGMLYGLTSDGGSTNRGAAYRLNPATGAVTILGEVPGALTGRTANSGLVQGNDGGLYGFSTTFAPSPQTHRMVRVDSATGAITVPLPNVAAPSELVRAPSGLLYGMAGGSFVRFDAAANQLVSLSSLLAGNGPVLAASDGEVYTVRQTTIQVGNAQGLRTSLLRLTQAPRSVSTRSCSPKRSSPSIG